MNNIQLQALQILVDFDNYWDKQEKDNINNKNIFDEEKED